MGTVEGRFSGMTTVVGVALLWSWSILNMTMSSEPYRAEFQILVSGVAFIAVALAHPLFASPVARKGVAIAGLTALFADQSVSFILMQHSFDAGVSSSLGLLQGFFGGIVAASLFFSWQLRLAFKGLQETKRILILSILLAIALFLLVTAVGGLFGRVIASFLPLASLLLALARPCMDEEGTCGPRGERRRASFMYYGVRVAVSLLMGFCIYMQMRFSAGRIEGGWLGPVSFVLAAAFPLALYVFFRIKPGCLSVVSENYFVLVPPVSIFFIAVPFLLENPAAFAGASSMMAYLLWFLLNAVQIPVYKRTLGIGETVIVSSVGAAIYLGWYLGVSAGSVVGALFAEASWVASFARVAAILPTCISVLLATAFIAQAAGERKRAADKSMPPDATLAACDTVASEYTLTGRELQVLALLAKGYTQPHIEKELMISNSTVKTHIGKIYQKTGCRKKEELITMVERMRAEFDAK